MPVGQYPQFLRERAISPPASIQLIDLYVRYCISSSPLRRARVVRMMLVRYALRHRGGPGRQYSQYLASSSRMFIAPTPAR